MQNIYSFKVLVVVSLLIACINAFTISSPHALADDSCAGRCNHTKVIPDAPCQCNKHCMRFGDCCSDYADLCLREEQISDKTLEDFTEELINLDVENNVTRYITVDLKAQNKPGDGLLTVSPQAYKKTTIKKLLKLHDNYNANVNITEKFTPEQEAEIDDFINAIFKTRLMQRAQAFLKENDLPFGKEDFYMLWFHLYNRGGTTNSSSGFEHVFLAELNGKVGGLHNWEFFAEEEDATRLEFRNHFTFYDFGWKGSVIEHRFEWMNINKPISSMFIGTSPEFEMAIFTVCFYARVDRLCPVSIEGQKFKIQTFTLKTSRGLHVGTSFPDLNK